MHKHRYFVLGMLVTPMALFGLALAYASDVSIPHTFTAGTTAVADEVNQNFAAVAAAIDDNDLRLGALEAPLPSFYAYLTTRSLAADTDVVFDVEDHDDGGVYDTTTGVFTAPQAGLYLLSANCLASDLNVGIDLVKNDSVSLGLMFFHGPEGATTQQGMTVTVKLAQGDTVVLRKFGAFEVIEGSFKFSFFSGHLIR